MLEGQKIDAMEAILTRRSTRYYKPDPIEHEKIEQILDAARQTPSGGNNPSNHFMVICNQETLRNLAVMAEKPSPKWRSSKTLIQT